MTSNNFKQVIFGALARKGLRAQGASAFVKREKDKPKPEAEKEHCGCWTVIHEKVPHPKYGERVAYFEDKQVRDQNCRHAIMERHNLLMKTPVASPTAPVPFSMAEVDEEPQTAESHPLPADAYQCVATTKSGARCKNKTHQANDRCGVHQQ